MPVLWPDKALLSTSNISKFMAFIFTTSPLYSSISIRSSTSNGLFILIYIPQKKLNIKSLRAIVKAADMTLINVKTSLINLLQMMIIILYIIILIINLNF